MKKLLVDTNIFLEILLGQKKKDECKEFLNKNIGCKLFMSNSKTNIYLLTKIFLNIFPSLFSSRI